MDGIRQAAAVPLVAEDQVQTRLKEQTNARNLRAVGNIVVFTAAVGGADFRRGMAGAAGR